MSARPPDDTRVYAVGDVHGCVDLLAALQRQIVADAADAPERRRVVVYLGDYVDRGPDSAGVIDRFLEKPLEGFESVHLKGNHEDLMLRFLDDPATGTLWLMNGGAATLRSYGIDRADRPYVGDMGRLRDALRDALPERHLNFLGGLMLSHREGDYFFAHAGVRPQVALDQQSAEDLTWIRDPFLRAQDGFGCMVIHGHTPVRRAEVHPNRIAVDTGAVWSGRLTAVALHGRERRFLET